MGKIRLFTALAVVALLLAAAGVLQATAISGSVPFAAIGVTENGSDLSTSTLLTASATATSGGGLGDFSIVPIGTFFSGFTLDLTMISSGGGFTITNATYGSFTASAGSILMQTPEFLNVDLPGTYTPGPAFMGLGPAPADVNLSFTQNGNVVSASFTLMTVGATVPETGTMALMGSGALVLAVVLRRRLFSNTKC